jgi:XRE family transcriptional regulator, regulator of sulfur utilization
MNESQAEDFNLGRRLRAQRLQAHLSMRQVARRAGVAVSYVSNLEAGRVSATLATLRKVLVALGTDLGPFFAERPSVPPGFVFRRQQMHSAAEATRSYTFILPPRGDIRFIILDEELFAGEQPEFESLSGDLAGYVLSGELLLEMADEQPQTLLPGDGFYIPAGRPARGHCGEGKSVRLITVQLQEGGTDARGETRHRGHPRQRRERPAPPPRPAPKRRTAAVARAGRLEGRYRSSPAPGASEAALELR